MAKRKCKCRICGKGLTTDIAYKVIKNDKSLYFCSEEEYNAKQKEDADKEKCYNTLASIMDMPMPTPQLKKEINKIRDYYGWGVIIRTIKTMESQIRYFIGSKDFTNEYGMIRYVITIIANNINAVNKEYIKEQKQIEKLFKVEKVDIDVDIINADIPIATNGGTDISEFLD